MISPALAQLRQLQQSLYEKAYKEAHSIVAGTSRAILSYSVKFEKSLPRRFVRTTQAELLDAFRRHRFVLYGDFHTLRQSQRGLLRLLRAYVEKRKSHKLVLALEMFKAIDQDFLDGYLAGRIPESEFLDAINYAGEWGFPWPNFKMILDFARARKLPVIGINTENAGRDTLAARDKFAARRLAWAAERYPDHKVVCLIGEYHLADGHLPRALAAELGRRGQKGPTLRVLNNVDQYYFDLNREPSYASTEYLRMRKDFFCVMNSPPWMKWQSFSFWEELRSGGASQVADAEGGIDQDLDLYTEETFDVDYQFLHFVRNLAGFLQLKIDASDMESFHIHYSPGGDFLRDLTLDGTVASGEAERMIGRAIVDGVHFLSRTNTVLLTNISINNLAEAAGQYLHTLITGFDDALGGTSAEAFYRRVFKSAIGMIASKILNPRRKCMELHNFRQLVRRVGGTTGSGAASDGKRQLARGVLRFDRWMELRLANPSAAGVAAAPPPALLRLDKERDYELSRAIGQMLGFNLYKKVIANKEPPSRIRRTFRKALPGYEALWSEIAGLYGLLGR